MYNCYPRCYVSVTVHGGYVYALGGFDGRTRQRSAERFHPSSNQWSMIQPMLCPRSDGGSATVNGRYLDVHFIQVQLRYHGLNPNIDCSYL